MVAVRSFGWNDHTISSSLPRRRLKEQQARLDCYGGGGEI
jgi:hypothetical protein